MQLTVVFKRSSLSRVVKGLSIKNMLSQEDLIFKQASKLKGPCYKRPEHVKIPTVWKKFESKTPRADGTLPKFVIQDITEEWAEEIYKYSKNLLQDVMGIEAFEKSNGEFHAKLLEVWWRFVLKDSVGLMCLTDDDTKPRLAGFQINEVCTRLKTDDDCFMKGSPENVTSFFRSQINIRRLVNVFEKCKVDVYVDAWGLFVHPEFRYQGIGFHLQHAKIALCKALGIKIMANGFGSDIATHVARKVGFRLIDRRPLSEVYYDMFGKVLDIVPSTNQFHEFYAMEVE